MQSTPEERLLDILRGRPVTLFAVLDAAREPRVPALLAASGEPHQSLYEGAKGDELADVAPYLVQLSKESPLLETLARDGWGRSWGVFIESDQPFKEVRRQLRRFLMVESEDGRELYFRFYDPRVLRVFLDACSPREAVEFLGPVGAYLVESEDGASLLRYGKEPQGVRQEPIALSS